MAIFSSLGHTASSTASRSGGVPGVGQLGQPGVQLGPVRGELGEQHVGAGHEHAGVPAVPALREVGGGGGGVRLLDERCAPRAPTAPPPPQRVPCLDVPEGGGGPVRLDAIVTTYPARAAATASRTGAWNASTSWTTWSAANEPTTTPGRRRSAPRPAQPDGGGGVPGRRLGEQVARRELRQLLRDGAACADPVTTRMPPRRSAA
jgi:hypothetical protein